MTWLIRLLHRLTYRDISRGEDMRVCVWRANARSAMVDQKWPMLRRVE